MNPDINKLIRCIHATLGNIAGNASAIAIENELYVKQVDPAILSPNAQYPYASLTLTLPDEPAIHVRVAEVANLSTLADIKKVPYDDANIQSPLWFTYLEFRAASSTLQNIAKLLQDQEWLAEYIKGHIRYTEVCVQDLTVETNRLTGYVYLYNHDNNFFRYDHWYYDSGRTLRYLRALHSVPEIEHFVKAYQKSSMDVTMLGRYHEENLDGIVKHVLNDQLDMDVQLSLFLAAMGAPIEWFNYPDNSDDCTLSKLAKTCVLAVFAQYVYPLYNAVREDSSVDQAAFVNNLLRQHAGLKHYLQDAQYPVFDEQGSLLNLEWPAHLTKLLWDQYLQTQFDGRTHPMLPDIIHEAAIYGSTEGSIFASKMRHIMSWIDSGKIKDNAILDVTAMSLAGGYQNADRSLASERGLYCTGALGYIYTVRALADKWYYLTPSLPQTETVNTTICQEFEDRYELMFGFMTTLYHSTNKLHKNWVYMNMEEVDDIWFQRCLEQFHLFQKSTKVAYHLAFEGRIDRIQSYKAMASSHLSHVTETLNAQYSEINKQFYSTCVALGVIPVEWPDGKPPLTTMLLPVLIERLSKMKLQLDL